MGHVGTQATNGHVVPLGQQEFVHANGDEGAHVGIRVERRCPLERTQRSSPPVGIAGEMGAFDPQKMGTARGIGAHEHVYGIVTFLGEKCATFDECIRLSDCLHSNACHVHTIYIYSFFPKGVKWRRIKCFVTPISLPHVQDT